MPIIRKFSSQQKSSVLEALPTEITPVSGVVTLELSDTPLHVYVNATQNITLAATGFATGRQARCVIFGSSTSVAVSVPLEWLQDPLLSTAFFAPPNGALVLDIYAGADTARTLSVSYRRSAGTGFRFLRILITDGNGSGLYPSFWLEYGNAAGYLALPMTSNTLPAPFVASAKQTYYLAGYEAWRAFAKSSEGWNGGGLLDGNNWITIDLGSTGRYLPQRMRITPKGTVDRAPVAWQVMGSLTGAFSGEETVLHTASGQTTGWTVNQPREYTF